jgi:hypothetical protein
MESDLKGLLGRIDAEFSRSQTNLERLRKERLEEHRGRQTRLALFEQACEKLKDVWGPRLEALNQAFGERVQATPQMATGRRQATFRFTSDLARITLTFSATTDLDVRSLILEYSLEILPVLMSYPDHARLEQPLEKIDPAAIGTWIDDRIVDVVRTYLSLHENEFYLKAHMTEDPIAQVRFPTFAAAATLERNGKTLYFMANETRDEYLSREAG